jgi:sec-independent protein translocase protein TatA
MWGLGFPELLVILVIALLVFGPSRLPEVGSFLGKSLRAFRDSLDHHEGDDDHPEEPRTRSESEKLPPGSAS